MSSSTDRCDCCKTAFTPPEVWCGKTAEDVKLFNLDYDSISPTTYSAFSGPDVGVDYVNTFSPITCDKNSNNNFFVSDNKSSSSKLHWSRTSRKAHGVSVSLYDKNPLNGKVSGDPIADCFAYVAKKNNALLVVADGVNWGEKPRLAARCAVNEAVNFIHNSVFEDHVTLHTTKDALDVMRQAFDHAHSSIIRHNGGLTTLNVTMVLPLSDTPRYAVCCVNVGDSLTYVYSKRYGMNELSIGSHDITEERDMRDAGGALGPVCGDEPYLDNLTFSLTTCEPGDIVFLTTDGVSDNFDPVVTKIAVPAKKDGSLNAVDQMAEMLPHERHLFSMKEMELVLHEYELNTETDISAQDLCTSLIDHIKKLTKAKRVVIENPELYNRQYKAKERRKIEEAIKKKLKTLPGKLDHATVIAYEAGVYRDEVTPNSDSESSLRKVGVDDSNDVIQTTVATYFESNV